MSKVDVYDALSEAYGKFKDVAFNICNDANKADDVVQMTMEAVLKMPKETLQDIFNKGGLLFYIIRIITLNIKSKTSRYYYKYEKYYERIDGNTTAGKYSNDFIGGRSVTHIRLDAIEELLNDLYWYDKELFSTYMAGGYTLDTLAEETGISRTSIFHTIKRVKKYIKENVKEKARKIKETE
tara:strand:+ start:13804 stop:14349 length:546 start_codon:yes stop_codon:yes gene_type:complete